MAFPKQITRFNKHVLNPVLGRVARSAHGPFAIIRHVGRRSGKTYETPVIVVRLADGFALALTYGDQVDWYRNVRTAGRCVVIWHRVEYPMDRIEPLDSDAGRALFPQPERAILGIVGIQHYVKMSRRSATEFLNGISAKITACS